MQSLRGLFLMAGLQTCNTSRHHAPLVHFGWPVPINTSAH